MTLNKNFFLNYNHDLSCCIWSDDNYCRSWRHTLNYHLHIFFVLYEEKYFIIIICYDYSANFNSIIIEYNGIEYNMHVYLEMHE